MSKPSTILQDPEQSALRELLRDMLKERGESLSQFGRTLAHTIDSERAPFTKPYIIRLRDGSDRITEPIAKALHTLAAMQDGVSELQARMRPVTMLAVYDHEPGTVVLGKSKPCALPGCRIRFVPVSTAQRYCSIECRKEAQKRKRIAARDVKRLQG